MYISQPRYPYSVVYLAQTTTLPCIFDCGNGECLYTDNLVCDKRVQCRNGKDEDGCKGESTHIRCFMSQSFIQICYVTDLAKMCINSIAHKNLLFLTLQDPPPLRPQSLPHPFPPLQKRDSCALRLAPACRLAMDQPIIAYLRRNAVKSKIVL